MIKKLSKRTMRIIIPKNRKTDQERERQPKLPLKIYL